MAQQIVKPPYPFSLKDELEKNPELKESDLQALREWCNKQPHLPKVSDQYLVLFLNSNYFQLEPTKNTIENYFTMRTHTPEFFSKRDPIGSKSIREAIPIAPIIPWPKRSPEGYAIVYGYLLDTDPSHLNLNESVKVSLMIYDLLVLKNGPENGYIFIGDCTGVSFGHVGRMNPMSIKKLVYYVQDALPLRLKAVHFINASPVVDVIFNMAKQFMNKDLANLIHIHSSNSTLAEFMPLDIVPQLDADAKIIDEIRVKICKEIEDKREWYLEEAAKYRVNETLRVGETKSANTLFGVEGSFKKLDID